MSKHFKNKTPSQTPKPLHESSPETKVHSTVTGADTIAPPMWHHSKPLAASFKHAIANPKGIDLPPPAEIEVPLPWVKHQKELENEILPDPEKFIPEKLHIHPPLL